MWSAGWLWVKEKTLAQASQQDSLAQTPGQAPALEAVLRLLRDDYRLLFLLKAVEQ